ncbi:hypothetical protein DSL72_002372 [Monilinia vaccinii-corymbosi]|uniref:DNase1 protein n=1 Tax=Monilinia vaccinii-corymbosi TaxID=61207 RepID=A0A8A3PCI4_9HELO|nr:hypothetical protein DSL72_002372 [Monilinia vaccinii-corymbosi]
MQFTTSILAAVAALASITSAGTVHFVNQDNTTRTIIFTPNPECDQLASITVGGHSTAIQTFPHQWVGNFFSRSAGASNNEGMLGEVCFDSWGGLTYFDVSAIVSPNDVVGVKELFPLASGTPISGCQEFPCANAYNKPDDIQTQATHETELVCLLGNLKSSKRSVGRKFNRDLVTGAGSA